MPQTVAAALFLERSEIDYDHVVGYEYGYISICPSEFKAHAHGRCTCTQSDYRSNYLSLISVIAYAHIHFLLLANNAKICTPLFQNIVSGIV